MKYNFVLEPRARQAAISGVIAFALLLLGNLTSPLDQLIWTLQSRLTSFEASGDIVFVGASEDLADPAFPERRRMLASGLRNIARSGARHVYIDVPFEKASDPSADRELRAAMLDLGARLHLVQNYETGIDGEDRLVRTTPELSQGFSQVGKSNYTNFMGYVWDAPFSLARHDNPAPSLPVAMSGHQSTSRAAFPINYSFRLASIPSLDLENVVSAPGSKRPLAAVLGNRTVLIGNADFSQKSSANIPGHVGVPASLVQVYAAETIRAGLTTQITAPWLLAGYLLALCAAVSLLRGRTRRFAIVLAVLSLPALVVAGSYLGIRVSVAPALILMSAYGLLRAKENWRSRFKLVDSATGLPTFDALETETPSGLDLPTLAVAKIHRLEEIKGTLPAEMYQEYVKKIVERLRLNGHDQTVHIGHGHYLAWRLAETDPRIIREHLEGLRALLSASLRVGSELIDVGITFSIDTNPSSPISKRLAAAVAAAERTTEAYTPIATTERTSDEDLLWSISLQARIDTALSNREIFLVFQPKILLSTGDVVGVEALVRWNDPLKGLIPPDLFIRQCESTGRMLHLTKYVLKEACQAANVFRDLSVPLPIAVNISATLLHDRDIVDALRDVLNETKFEASLLTLEITETYRILDLQTARDVLEEIVALGPKISMDDFGVGAASFEALLRLPFHELKIDRLFVSKITSDPKARGIVRHVLQLGKDLRIAVVAEGVEDAATLAMLKDMGCVVAQGFAIAPPLPADGVLNFARSGTMDKRAHS